MEDEPLIGGGEKGKQFSTAQKVFAEAIGTSGLTFLACGVAVGGVSNTAICIAFGAVVVMMAYCIGNVSGCHINPAISLNMFLRKQMKFSEFIAYISGQFIGSFAGSLCLGVFNRLNFSNMCCNRIQQSLYYMNEQKVYVKDFYSYLDAIMIETILTFFFVMAVNGATDKNYSDGKLAGLIIGVSLMLGVSAGFGFTGGSLNPWRSLSPAICEAFSGQLEALKESFVFILGPCFGASIAAITYSSLFN